MTQPNEVKITIRAIKKDFDKVQSELERWRGRMVSQSNLIKQKFNEEAAAARAAAKAQIDAAKSVLEHQQKSVQFRANMESQRFKEIGQAQAEAIKENKAYDDAQKRSAQAALDRQRGIMQLIASLEQQKIKELEVAAAANLKNQQGRVQFRADMEAQKLRELTKAQQDANRVNQEGMQVRRGLVGVGLDMLARLEGKSFEEATEAIRHNKEVLTDWARGIAIVAAAATAAAVVIKKAFDFGQEGAMMLRLSEAGSALAKSYGVDLTEAVGKVKAASLDTISTQQAILSTNRALLLGVSRDADQLAKLMEIAAIRGRATGLDTVEAFDRITLGIGRLSTRILDDIGIVVDGETAYANYGKEIGKTADQLTEAEKRIALTNAIIADGNVLLAAAGGVTEDTAAKFSQFTTNIQDMGDKLKMISAGPLGLAVELLNTMLFQMNDLTEQYRLINGELAENSKTYAEYVGHVRSASEAQLPFLAGLAKINEKLAQYTFLAPVVETATSTIATAWIAAGNAILGSQWGEFIQSLTALSEEQFNAGKAADAHADAVARANAIHEAAKAGIQELKDKVKEAQEEWLNFSGTIDDADISGAIEQALGSMQEFGATQGDLDGIRLAFGLIDQSILNFRSSIMSAMSDAKLSIQEVSGALIGLIQAKLAALSQKFNDDLSNLGGGGGIGNNLAKLKDDLFDKLGDITRDLGRKIEDINRDLAESLSDLSIDSQRKREDAARDHARSLIKIEEDYQRQIKNVRDRFEMSRLRALIDLDARALFEAEAQRDADLADAKDKASEKRADERDDYAEQLEDLARYHAQREADLARDADRRVEDANRDAEERRRDAHEDYAERLAEQVSAGGVSRKKLEEQYAKEKKLLEDQLATARDLLDGHLKGTVGQITKNGNAILGAQKDDHARRTGALKDHHIELLRKYDEQKDEVTRRVNDSARAVYDTNNAWYSAILAAAAVFFGRSLEDLSRYIAEWNRRMNTRRDEGGSSGGGTGERETDPGRAPPILPDFRALGMDVTRGNAVVTGDRGPEVFLPSTSGRIVSSNELAHALGQGGRNGNTTVRVVFDVKGDSALAKWLRDMTRQSAIEVVSDVMA